jgi:predicted DNA-binding transcriptional regulator AlpA
VTTPAIQQARADDAVLTFREWCVLNSFSRATGQRIKKSDDSPKFIQLSQRRIGITLRENREWQARRAK